MLFFQPNIAPHPALQPYVRRYFLLHVNNPANTQQRKPMPTDGLQSMYFYPRNAVLGWDKDNRDLGLSPSSVVVGGQVSRLNLQFGVDHLVIQAAFHPGMLHRLLGIPITEIADLPMLAAELFFGPSVKELDAQLAELTDYRAMIDAIDVFLLKKIQHLKTDFHAIDAAIAQMSTAANPITVDQLAKTAFLSTRQLERKFYERMGVSPKLYGRILRFNQAYKSKMLQPEKSWLHVAYDAGYYDFRHLSRDFADFAGSSPALLLQEEFLAPDGGKVVV